MDKNSKYLVGLSSFWKFGPVSLSKLKRYFQTTEDAFQANSDQLIKAGINEKVANEFIQERKEINLDQILEKLNKENIKIITPNDDKYPKLLSEIFDPPEILYYKGNLDNLHEFNISVVGARKFTSYGRMAIENIIPSLTEAQIGIISGLAIGIDSLAHYETIKNSGHTVAVLGTGIDNQSVYPSSNKQLAERIIDSGGVIFSEFPIGTPPLKHHFPQRNRIVSGLSLGTLVVEAAEKSGALITAKCSLEQNREVLAVPGNIFSLVSKGPNNLIKQGAHPVTSASDIIDALGLENVKTHIESKKTLPETEEETLLLATLSHDPTHINDIIQDTKMSTSVVSSTLTIMEMKGMVKNVGGMEYVLK